MLNLSLKNSTNDLYKLIENTNDEEVLHWLKTSEKNLLKAELYVAERMARIGGKRKTYNTHAFEVYLDENIDRLADALYFHEYKPSRGITYIINNPVKREIFAAPYVDRVVHHYLVDTINPWWDRRLNAGASSCRVGKGTSYGIALLDKHIRQASHNFKVPVYVIKLDISGYFMHIDRNILLERVFWGLDRQFEGNYGKRYKIAKYTLEQIIMDNPIDGVKMRGSYEDWRDLPTDKSLFMAPKGCGLVIGNVTSQVFSNIYLDPLDRFVTMNLGYKYYGRYVDDFYIVVPESLHLEAWNDLEKIEKFLKKELRLTLHPDKRSMQPSCNGVAFLGAVVYPKAIHPGKRLKKRTRKAFYDFVNGKASSETIISYVGHMRYMKHHKFLSA